MEVVPVVRGKVDSVTGGKRSVIDFHHDVA
jgi:hypothetical protein